MLLRPTPTRRNRCCELMPTRSRRERAIFVSSSQEDGGVTGVWLGARILNSLVFSLSATVRAIRDSLQDAAHVCSKSADHRLHLGQQDILFEGVLCRYGLRWPVRDS